MRIFWIALGSLLVAASSHVVADPIALQDSTSPNGALRLAIEPGPANDPDYSPGQGKLQIRRLTDRKVVSSFDWGQFGPVTSPTSATVVWRDDSRAFALTWYMTRGFTGSQVFVKGSGRWFDLELPLFPTRGAQQHLQSNGKGHYVVTQWLPNSVLKARYESGLVWDGKGSAPTMGDVEEDDWVFLQLEEKDGEPRLKFLRLEAAHEHGYDL